MNMKRALLTLAAALLLTPLAAQEKIIFDTDFGGDADDLGALTILNNLENDGVCEITAIMVYSNYSDAIAAIDGVNRYYGNDGVPMAIRNHSYYDTETSYCNAVATTLPHELTNDDVPLCIDLYREILSQADDKSITLVTVGPLANIKELIDSKADKHSPLTGLELMNRKLKGISMMGGAFPAMENEWNFWGNSAGTTRYVLDKLATPIAIIGYEVGQAVKIGNEFNKIKGNNPLYPGFLYFSEHAPWMKADFKGAILDNPCYDQITLLHGIYGDDHKGWEMVEGWRCVVEDNSATQWVEDEKSNHRYMRVAKHPTRLRNEVRRLMMRDIKPD